MCFVCEREGEGLRIPFDDGEVAICSKCLLEYLMRHPILRHRPLGVWKETKNVA